MNRKVVIHLLAEAIADKQIRKKLLKNVEDTLSKMGVPVSQPHLLPTNAADLNIRP